MKKSTVTAKFINKQSGAALCLLTLVLLVMPMAVAGVENPLKKNDMKIQVLDDYQNYADVQDIQKDSLSADIENQLTYEKGALKIRADGKWQDLKFANYGLSKRGKMPDDQTTNAAGSFQGAEGIGVRVKVQQIGTFTVSFTGRVNNTDTYFQLKPDAPYYVIAKDGVTNKAHTVDTGYGFGTMSTLPARENYDCILLVPFASLYNAGSGGNEGFDPASAVISHMLYKIYHNNTEQGVVLYSVFLYGQQVQSFQEQAVLSFFVDPDPVERPKDYSVPQQIHDARKAAWRSSDSILKTVFIALGIISLGGMIAFTLVLRHKRSSHAQTENESCSDKPRE